METEQNREATFLVSLETERSLLGTLLLKSELWRDAANELQAEDFSLEAHRQIFAAMLESGRLFGGFDPLSISQQLNGKLTTVGGLAYLSELIDNAIERRDISGLCHAIRESAVRRRIARHAELLQTAAESTGTPLNDCRQFAAQLLAMCDYGPCSKRLVACPVLEFVSLDIPVREMVLAPIIPAQGLVMLHSKRGVGKTYISLGIALAVASGDAFLCWNARKPRSVLFVDGELPQSTLQQRIISIAAGALPRDLRIVTPDMQHEGMPDLATVKGTVRARASH